MSREHQSQDWDVEHEYDIPGTSSSSGGFSKKPAHLDFNTRYELHQQRFQEILARANLRLLVRYIEDGELKLDDIGGIPVAWRDYFKKKSFRGQVSFWQNPSLNFIKLRRAAELAAKELFSRIEGKAPPSS